MFQMVYLRPKGISSLSLERVVLVDKFTRPNRHIHLMRVGILTGKSGIAFRCKIV